MQLLLDQYLSAILSQPVASTPLEGAKLRGVPQYLAQRYRFRRCHLAERSITFAVPTVQEGLTPSSVSKDLGVLQDQLGTPVVLVREQLASWERARYVAARIPFVVPGEQLFLPMLLIELRDVKRRPASEVTRLDHLTWAAQVVMLRHLLHDDVEGVSLQDLAERLRYSRMTITKVQRELQSHGLCRVEQAGRTKRLAFDANRLAIRKKTLAVSRSPVRERRFLVRCDVDLPAAGLSALAARTDLAAEARRAVAVAGSEAKGLIEREQLTPTPDPDAATTILEIWNYDPILLSSEGIVDPLSLYLSLRADPDERVQGAIVSMMEALPWSTA